MSISISQYKVSFEEAYTLYYSRMKRFAQSYVIHEEDAEDIVQDIFFELWRKKIDFSTITNISGFLFITLKNKCIDFIRRKTTESMVKTKLQDEYTTSLKIKLNSLYSLNDVLLTSEDLESVINKAIDNLPERCRQIFIMNKYYGKKQKAIAMELNISIHTVENQIAIAYKKLKEELKEYIPLLIFLFL